MKLACNESNLRTSLASSSPRNSTSHSISPTFRTNLYSVLRKLPITPSGIHFRKSGMDVSRSCSRVFRTQMVLERLIPSLHGAILAAWCKIFMIPAVVLVDPTGPTAKDMNFSE